ncbi:hypothetical protein CIHG_05770 [Coccidioides immitis H538.4]|uniref:Uncharacterized protein n=2 Tax=Coccidioides immitis TaxID=5501 RepID=A0A0J8RT82_COCIT|nr:hypothetical protein CIRG_01840 [Coccidioides immitis RMSCC 2394]KMU88002.1 hypothetical protein CIHG_05770 [Coccidioides immitis H538.4]
MYQKIAVDSPDGFKTGQITVIRSQIDKGFRLLNRNRNRNSAPGYEAKSKSLVGWCVGHYQQTRSPKLHKTTALLHHAKQKQAVFATNPFCCDRSRDAELSIFERMHRKLGISLWRQNDLTPSE